MFYCLLCCSGYGNKAEWKRSWSCVSVLKQNKNKRLRESLDRNQKLPCGTFKFTPLCWCPDTELTLYTVKWGTGALRNVALHNELMSQQLLETLTSISFQMARTARAIHNFIHAHGGFIRILCYSKTFSHFIHTYMFMRYLSWSSFESTSSRTFLSDSHMYGIWVYKLLS